MKFSLKFIKKKKKLNGNLKKSSWRKDIVDLETLYVQIYTWEKR